VTDPAGRSVSTGSPPFNPHSSVADIQKSIYLTPVAQVSNREALWEFVRIMGPAVMGVLLKRAVLVSNYMYAGRLDDSLFMGGMGLGELTANLMCVSVGIGLGGGIDTLSSTAFGNKSYYLAGSYYNSAMVLLTVIFAGQAVILWNATDILMFLGQPESTSILAGEFLRHYMVGIFSLCQVELLRKFLGAQGNFTLITKVQMGTFVVHLLCLYLFVHRWGMGINGIAIASSITHFLTLSITMLYMTLVNSSTLGDSWH